MPDWYFWLRAFLALTSGRRVRISIVQAQDKARALANLAAEHMLRMVEINDIALRNAIKYFSLRDVDQSGGIWADWHNLAHLEGSGIAGEVSQVRYMLIIGSRWHRPPALASLPRSAAERQGPGLLRRAGRHPQIAHCRPPVRRGAVDGGWGNGTLSSDQPAHRASRYRRLQRRGRRRDPAGNLQPVLRVPERRPAGHPVPDACERHHPVVQSLPGRSGRP